MVIKGPDAYRRAKAPTLINTKSLAAAAYSTLQLPRTSNGAVPDYLHRNCISADSDQTSDPEDGLRGSSGSSVTVNDHPSPTTRGTDPVRRQLNSRIDSMLIQSFVKELASWVSPFYTSSAITTKHDD
jgi:hypothetical protein